MLMVNMKGLDMSSAKTCLYFVESFAYIQLNSFTMQEVGFYKANNFASNFRLSSRLFKDKRKIYSKYVYLALFCLKSACLLKRDLSQDVLNSFGSYRNKNQFN